MKNPTKALLSSLTVAALVLTGCSSGDGSDPSKELTYDQAVEQLNAYVDEGKVQYTEVEHAPDTSWVGVDTTAADLPEIDNYPLSVTGSGDLVVEIASSTEKSGVKGDRWLDIMAKEFNASGATVDGKRVAVSVRPMASGLAYDYITSGKYVPEAYSPANELWITMIAATGVEVQQVEDRLVGNTAGILMKESTHTAFTEKYGEVTVPKAVEAVLAGDLKLGHTDPNLSSTGLNMLLEELQAMDAQNPLSPAAMETFRQFQAKVPAASLTTDEMSEVAKRGLADAMIMESQAFTAKPELATGWVFTPAGVRHDSPLYAMNRLAADKVEVLKQFAAFTQTMEAQKAGSSFGFNLYDDYRGAENNLSAAQISGALDAWKTNKDGGVPLVTMIVVDRSGSMDGTKMLQAKQALLSGAGEINSSNYVGMVSYGSDITVDLPIGEFTDEQRSLFVGAANDLVPGGGTATNSAIIVALAKMREFDPNQQYKHRIILISDGQQTEGLGLNAALQVVGGLRVPVYSISFETDSVLDDMKTLASVGRESASVTIATSEDVRTVFKNVARNAL